MNAFHTLQYSFLFFALLCYFPTVKAFCVSPMAIVGSSLPAQQERRSMSRSSCVMLKLSASRPDVITRSDYITRLQTCAALLGAAAINLPAVRAYAANATPKFIDVSIDLGLGQDLILNVRQPYGLAKESKADREDGGDRQGTYVWPASTDLGKFLVSESGRKLVRGKNVVELGAGTAISGLAAAIAGASRVTFTDGSQEVLAVTKDTVSRNSAASSSPELLRVERLRWGNKQDLAALLGASEGGYDVVLGAEITYLSSSLNPLLDSMRELLESSSLARPGTKAGSKQHTEKTEVGEGAGSSGAVKMEITQTIEFDILSAQPFGLMTFTPELTAFDGKKVLPSRFLSSAPSVTCPLI